jgi:uncharacterized SAM-binding protein YcdF (DUF218 family)
MKFFKRLFLFLFLVALTWAAGFGCYVYYITNTKPASPERQTDAIVVLTGSGQRVETGLDLFAKGRARYLFISGVNPQVTENEIRVMWKRQPQLPQCCIVLGQDSLNTIENARETHSWVKKMNFTSIRLVTADYHMPRALLELRHQMPDTLILLNPMPQPPEQLKNRAFWLLMLSEYNKILVRWMSLKLNLENTA